MENWLHKVQYYETDQMQIVHHSNYIKWFEEARMYLLEKIGFTYFDMEEAGIVVPVLSVLAEYKGMVRFGDTVEIEAKVTTFTGVKLIVSYEIRDIETQEVRTTGESKHTFLDKDTYRTISLRRTHPDLYKLFNEMLENPKEE